VTFLALDLGRRRAGVAISHGILAKAMLTLSFDENKIKHFILELEKIIIAQSIDVIVVGLPLGNGQEETPQSQWTKKIGKILNEELNLPVEYVEEGYSTTEAKERIIKEGLKKEDLDAVSAKIILEQFLNEKS